MKLIWLGALAIVVWQVIASMINAFAVPWQGNLDQWLAIFYGVLFLIALVVLTGKWMESGRDGVMETLSARWRLVSTPPSFKETGSKYQIIFWIILAIILIVLFNLMEANARPATLNRFPPESRWHEGGWGAADPPVSRAFSGQRLPLRALPT